MQRVQIVGFGRSAGGGRAVVNGAASGVSALAGFHPYRGVSGGFAPIAPSKGDEPPCNPGKAED